MPLYEYECQACGNHLEAQQRLADAPLEKCPKCGKKKLQKLISATAFHLKGGGWYKDLYASQKPGADAGSGETDGKVETKSEPDGKSDAKPETKSDAKPDAKPDAKADGKAEAKGDGKPAKKGGKGGSSSGGGGGSPGGGKKPGKGGASAAAAA